MAIKYTYQGMLIYLTMAAYFFAFVARIAGRKLVLRSLGEGGKAAQFLYFVGFIIAAASFGYRWYHVQHIPFQNLFEVFLTMAMVVYPLSLFCRRFLRVGAEAADMLIGAIVLVPAGFVFSARPLQLPPALQCWLFAPHVAVYLFSYVIMAKAMVQALCRLKTTGDSIDSALINYEEGTYRMICLGFPLLTLGLLMGSWWGKLAWGDYWDWDPKELWGLASWLVYVEYFHVRYMFGKKYPRLNSAIAILGAVVIVITLLWVNLSRIFAGLHSYAT